MLDKFLQYNRLGSDFINVTAWLTMALTLSWLVMSCLYAALYAFVLPIDTVASYIRSGVDDGLLPEFASWAFARLPYYFASSILIAGATLWGSFDLLRRRNWARWFYILAIALTICGNLYWAGLLLLEPSYFFSPAVIAQAGDMLNVRLVLAGLIVLLSIVLGLMIVRLNTPEIVAEFQGHSEA